MSSFRNLNRPKQHEIDWTGFDLSEVKTGDSSLSSAHRFLVNYFEAKTGGRRLARREDLDPVELSKYLPNIFLHDLIFDEQGSLCSVLVRLFGTNMVDFFGELTGRSMHREEGDDIKDTSQQPHARMFRSMDLMLQVRTPVIANVEQISQDRPFARMQSLRIPLSQDGTNIDLVFGHAELILK